MGDSEKNDNLGWLANAIVRHLANFVSGYHMKTQAGTVEQFEGINERAAVALLSKIFEGLGYSVFYEQSVFGVKGFLDLWAGGPDGQPRWYVEAKMMWEGYDKSTHDNRLNRTAFAAFLSDLERLAECSGEQLEKVAVWFAFSPHEVLQQTEEDRQTMSLGDAAHDVRGRFPTAELTYRSIDLDCFGPCVSTTRFAHVFCWRIP